MEDPSKEVEGVVRALVDKPTFRRQENTLRRHFTSDVKFYHPFVNTNMGVGALIVIYQFAESLVSYSGVDFHTVAYVPTPNCVAVRMTVYTRPWLMFFRTIPLQFHTLLEITDVVEKLKNIKIQWDYFISSPIVQMILFIGDIYASDIPRFFFGDILAIIVLVLKSLILSILTILPGKSKVDVAAYDGKL